MKWVIITIILLENSPAIADALLDAIYGKYPTISESQCVCESAPVDDDGGEHLSWELGENESLPDLVIIENPYTDHQDY
jgi:hypothetical protein